MAFKVSFTTETKKITIRPHWLILEICIGIPLIIGYILVSFGVMVFNFLLFLSNKMINTFQDFIPSGIVVSDKG